MDETGKVCREVKVVSHPEDLIEVLKDPACGSFASGSKPVRSHQWLFSGLVEADLPVVCIETRHTKLSSSSGE